MSESLAVDTTNRRRGKVLFAGQSYYNGWYLSRELRKLGWTADLVDFDPNPSHDTFYHGRDFKLTQRGDGDVRRHLGFYLRALNRYDVFQFSNKDGITFGPVLRDWFARRFSEGAEIRLLKRLGKKVAYANNGCLDGVAQSSYAAWGDTPVCNDCPWRDRPDVCSDKGNLAWGKFRNEVADFQVTLGGNRIDYNDDPRVHEVPEFYCLDQDFWRPDLDVPASFRLAGDPTTLRIYHAVGNFDSRTDLSTNRNLKSTHIYVPLVEQLRSEGHNVELMFFKDVPNRELRFYQAQADIVVDMLTVGFFGATVREALMLGKPAVCYLREEWLDQMREQIPEYVEELPVVSATPDSIREVMIDLIENPAKRRELGRRGREFALKWHSAQSGARLFDRIYSGLLEGEPGDMAFRS